jgi:hypothetical protein
MAEMAATTINVFKRKDTALCSLFDRAHRLDSVDSGFQLTYVVTGEEPPAVPIPVFYVGEFPLPHPPQKSISIGAG